MASCIASCSKARISSYSKVLIKDYKLRRAEEGNPQARY